MIIIDQRKKGYVVFQYSTRSSGRTTKTRSEINERFDQMDLEIDEYLVKEKLGKHISDRTSYIYPGEQSLEFEVQIILTDEYIKIIGGNN